MIGQLRSSWLHSRSTLISLTRQYTFKFDKIGAPLGLLMALIIFSFLSAPFRRLDNLMLILGEASLVGIVAVGQTLVLLIGGIDLSVGSVVALTGVTSASLMKGFSLIPAIPSYLAISLGLLLGLLLGGLQGWLITNRNMPPFIVTLGTMIGLQGLTQAYTNAVGSPIYSLPDDFKWIAEGYVGPVPVPAVLMLLLCIVTWYVLHNTKFGHYCYAIGNNETSARLAGINVNRYKICVYALSGLLSAVAGIILIAKLNGGIYTDGTGYELNSIAATIIGGTSLSGGVGGVGGTLIGVLLMYTVNNGLTMCSVPPEWQQVVTGAIILLAVLVDVERRRRPKILVQQEETPRLVPTQLQLQQIIVQISELIEKNMGNLYCCLYLTDRETGEMLAQPTFKTGRLNHDENTDYQLPVLKGPSRLALQVKESGQPAWLEDLGRTSAEHVRIVSLHLSIQSVMAIPLYVQNRVIGVLEVQSPIPDCFSKSAATLLSNLCNPLADVLEDAWLLESGWLVKQVRDNLRHLWDDLHLGRSPLSDWLLALSTTSSKYTLGARGEALREWLINEIDSLKPAETRDPSRASRCHRILQLTYAEEYPVEIIIKELNISRRQYFYDLKEALEILADALVRDHQVKLQLVTYK